MNLTSHAKGHWLGAISYEKALEAQDAQYTLSQQVPLFLGFETQKPTITLGRSAQAESEILTSFDNCHVISTDRGGQATLHSPGQLVIFPVISLKSENGTFIGPRDLVCELLTWMYESLKLEVGSKLLKEDDGLYTDRGKLGFIGLRIRNKRVFHGISLNVSNDLSEFSSIRSCGREQAQHDLLANYLNNPQPKQVFEGLFRGSSRLTQPSCSM